jgi:hypothetical protein
MPLDAWIITQIQWHTLITTISYWKTTIGFTRTVVVDIGLGCLRQRIIRIATIAG